MQTTTDSTGVPAIAMTDSFGVPLTADQEFEAGFFCGSLRANKVSLQLTAINFTNKYALYNFLSTFSGTHYVTPRSLTAQLGFHF